MMKVLAASLVLCAVLALTQAGPLNYTMSRNSGRCEYLRHHGAGAGVEAFMPQCDGYGNFLPQQCSGATGFCWCVDVITGEEIPHTKTPPGSSRVDCGKKYECPYNWSRYGERCFIFVNSPKTWLEAESFCLFDGANLASVSNYDEGHFVQDLVRGFSFDFPEAWLGGHNSIYPYYWMWTDGYKFKYENWNRREKMEPTSGCLKMNYGYQRKWTCCPCNETLPFVCAKKL
ncbi:uncharacterized protein V6R79_013224 [Siganus canaliculatus]